MTRNELMKLNKYSLVETIMELQDQVNALINVKDKLLEENERLKNCYCNRTDCGGRIKNSKKYSSLQQRIDKAIPMLKELNIKLKEILKIGIDIIEISNIEEVLQGEDNE